MRREDGGKKGLKNFYMRRQDEDEGNEGERKREKTSKEQNPFGG